MKPSHERTPRNLNDCHFTHGYVSAPDNRPPRWADAAVTVLCTIGLVVTVPLVILGVL